MFGKEILTNSPKYTQQRFDHDRRCLPAEGFLVLATRRSLRLVTTIVERSKVVAWAWSGYSEPRYLVPVSYSDLRTRLRSTSEGPWDQLPFPRQSLWGYEWGTPLLAFQSPESFGWTWQVVTCWDLYKFPTGQRLKFGSMCNQFAATAGLFKKISVDFKNRWSSSTCRHGGPSSILEL